MATSTEVRTLIVGAGISGLATAAALGERRGLPGPRRRRPDRRLLQDHPPRRLRLGLLGPLLSLQAPRDRGLAARAHAGPEDPRRREEVVHRVRRPADRLPVPEEHPPAAARRIHRLPARSLLRAHAGGDRCSRARAAETNFKEMLYARFGRSIAEKFLIPYNEKLYACDLGTLDRDAMGRFFPHADLADIIRNMKVADNRSYNSTFTYPEGGAFEYVRALASAVRSDAIALGEPLIGLDVERRDRAHAAAGDPLRAAGLVGAVLPAGAALRPAARPVGVHLEQGAGLQPRLRSQGAARRALDLLPGPRDGLLPRRFLRQHLRHRSPERLRRDRVSPRTPTSTPTPCCRACSPTSSARASPAGIAWSPTTRWS